MNGLREYLQAPSVFFLRRRCHAKLLSLTLRALRAESSSQVKFNNQLCGQSGRIAIKMK